MRILTTLSVAVLVALPSRGAAPTPPAPLMARTQLAQATAAAKKWRPDAALTHVSSITVNADGSAKSWLYTFYAPQSKKSMIITAAVGEPLDTLQVPNTSMVPLGDTFVDSDRAMQLAKQHDLKGSNPSMGLVVMGITGSPIWSVNGGFAEGDVSVMLDGKTGAFIRREVISYK